MLIKSKPYDAVLIIGRFQPFHNVHQTLIDSAYKYADRVILALGSHRAAPNIYNSWSTGQRSVMARKLFPDRNLEIITINDYLYDDTAWIMEVQEKVRRVTKPGDKVLLYGHQKDYTSRYISWLKNIWDYRSFSQELSDKRKYRLDATPIRNAIFGNGIAEIGKEKKPWHEFVPNEIAEWIVHDFIQGSPSEYQHLKDEYDFCIRERKKVSGTRYAWQSNAVDPVVVQCGHVLVVRRKFMPGLGQLAFPGGFIEEYEDVENALMRELKEETTITINRKSLKRIIKNRKVFDHPKRDVRYRIFSHGYFIKLDDDEPLAIPQPTEESSESFFMPIIDFLNNSGNNFADHTHILQYFLGGM
jgi:bifunctional NMN adenylyltransferase/nudix hydrolase